MKIRVTIAVGAALFTGSRTIAQMPAPPGLSEPAFAARRQPQPVRVGDLIHRRVLQPVASRAILGHVERVVRDGNGGLRIVMNYGGWFGLGGRSIAVPAGAMVLLGDELEVLDFTPDQLAKFPTDDGSGSSPVAAGQLIRMGLAHPSH